jgi:succinate dehydrogenase/fumarate reductase flavoprotein subunit
MTLLSKFLCISFGNRSIFIFRSQKEKLNSKVTALRKTAAILEAACNSVHGANRLGANSTAECLVWGRITGELAARHAAAIKSSSIPVSPQQVLEEEKRIYDGIFRGKGK